MTGEKARRVTVTLPAALVLDLDEYRQTHGLASRSEAVAHAIEALREKEEDQRRRKALADEMTAEAQEMGLY